MKLKSLFLAVLIGMTCLAGAQGPVILNDNSAPVQVTPRKRLARIKLLHISPQLLFLLLEGKTNINTPPESQK